MNLHPRLMAAVARYRNLAASRATLTAGFALALLVFAVGLIWAWRTSDIQVLSWVPLAAVVFLVPVSVAAAAWQLRAMSAALGQAPQWGAVVRVTTMGSLSSLLPLSSGTMFRGGAMVYWGASISEASRTILVDAAAWLLVTLLTAGGASIWLREPILGGIFILIALAGAIVALTVSSGLPRRRLLSQLLAARVLGLAGETGRLLAAFAALGSGLRLSEALVFTAPHALASLVFFLPGGLGIREGLTAGIAEILGLAAGTAFLAAALDRIVGLTALLAWEAVVWVASPFRKR